MESGSLTTSTAWLGVTAYAFQIYFDFSGYSDMAIGIGRMIGFKFPENFNNPYISQSITEFWRRWHMTLGRFMKDYLYIPLGGNRVSPSRLYFNLWVVFLISGLWHGAAWNFVIWGAFHGLFLVLDRLFLLKFFKWIGKIPSVAITFFISLIGWVFFRAETLPEAMSFLETMFSFTGGKLPADPGNKFYIIFGLAILFSFFGIIPAVERWQAKVLGHADRSSPLAWMTLFSVIFFVISLASVTSSGFNPFIYFRF
jgi:alginate O-acetyltransferase complex protein AlgI